MKIPQLTKAVRQTKRLTKQGIDLTTACALVRRRYRVGIHQLFHALTSSN